MFRILDLGAHDGFVTNFIARQARNSGVEVHVDGVEANLHAVDLFNVRLDRDGISGQCRRGLAEKANELFTPGTYDAVVLYELVEHAPNVTALLSVAEDMCKPTGRVYVSTPNGTFGLGNNPHHLHCWTLGQLFDLLRRRGTITNALPGPDGVSVISYKPDSHQADLDVAIYAGPGWEKWAPTDIERKGLGGSETAAARLAESLTRHGCRVTVYGEVEPGAAGQVLYKHHSSFDPMERRGLLIASRIPEIADRRINARAALLWMHDVDCGPRLTEERASRFTRIMVLSEWQRKHVLDTYPFLDDDDIYVTRNGIEASYFHDGSVERNPHRAIYTSSPDRGLDVLLELWPQVRDRLPDAELAFAYASVYQAVAAQNPQIGRFRAYIDQLATQDGAVPLGSLTQPGVAKEMRASGLWLAPSWSTPAGQAFNETFCIGAVEAAAAGCYRLMSEWGALLERREDIDHSEWLAAHHTGLIDRELWVDTIVAAMDEPPSEHPSQVALGMSWDEVAADMLAAAG